MDLLTFRISRIKKFKLNGLLNSRCSNLSSDYACDAPINLIHFSNRLIIHILF